MNKITSKLKNIVIQFDQKNRTNFPFNLYARDAVDVIRNNMLFTKYSLPLKYCILPYGR